MFFAPVIRHASYAPATRTVDRSFERFVNDALLAPRTQTRNPATLVNQDDTAWDIQIDVPGLAREHLSIGIEGAAVRIESVEGAPRAFKGAYELPQEIDVAASSAKLEHGVLSLHLAKKQPVSNVTTLTID